MIKTIHLWNLIWNLRNWYVRKYLKKILRSSQAPCEMIDLGCGEGMHLLPYAAKFKNFSFTGYDRNPDAIELCHAFKNKTGLDNLQLKQLDFGKEKIPQKAKLAVCSSTLQYLDDDIFGLQNIYHSLEGNGQLLLYVPVNGKVILPFYRWVKEKIPGYDQVQEKKQNYNGDQLMTLLKQTGFIIESTHFVNGNIGIIGHELYYIFVMLTTQSTRIISFFTGFVFVALSPVILLMKLIDYLITHSNGNGMMILARKVTE